MNDVTFYPGREQTGGCLWFTIPRALQDSVNYVFDRLSEDDDAVLASQAYEILTDTNKYSDSLNVRVGSRLYYIYKREGEWRLGAGGLNSTSNRAVLADDEDEICAYFASQLV